MIFIAYQIIKSAFFQAHRLLENVHRKINYSTVLLTVWVSKNYLYYLYLYSLWLASLYFIMSTRGNLLNVCLKYKKKHEEQLKCTIMI